MNTSYTQVDIEQLRTLINSMARTKSSCSSALNDFSRTMDTLISSGQIAGTALTSFENNMSKIESLHNDFAAYCDNVTRNLNNIIAQEQDIETRYNTQYNDLLSINPDDFNE